jgi:uncharacterized membrane protein
LAATALWLGVFGTFAVARHLGFVTARFDLGDMTQALWNTAHGRFLQATNETGETTARLAGHVDPLLAAFTPLWWLWPSPLLLVSIVPIALAAGALPVYWLARKHLASEGAAFAFALVYLTCPLTQWNAIFDFHAVTLAIPLLLFAIWFLDENRLIAFTVAAVLAGATKEEIPAAIGLLGIWYARSHGRKALGAAIFFAGLAATVIDFTVVIPHFAPGGTNPFSSRYGAVGSTPGGILDTAISHPDRILNVALTPHKLGYIVLLLVLFGGLSLASPLLALCALPDIVINILSAEPNQTSLKYQYTAGILPFLLAAAIIGSGRLRPLRERAPSIALVAGLSACILLGPLGLLPETLRVAAPGNLHRQAAAGAVALIPPDAPVSASNRLGGHLSIRREIYLFPIVRNATWVAVDSNDPTSKTVPAFQAGLRQIENAPGWQRVYDRRGVFVYRKK